jgi:hypothetical protein
MKTRKTSRSVRDFIGRLDRNGRALGCKAYYRQGAVDGIEWAWRWGRTKADIREAIRELKARAK